MLIVAHFLKSFIESFTGKQATCAILIYFRPSLFNISYSIDNEVWQLSRKHSKQKGHAQLIISFSIIRGVQKYIICFYNNQYWASFYICVMSKMFKYGSRLSYVSETMMCWALTSHIGGWHYCLQQCYRCTLTDNKPHLLFVSCRSGREWDLLRDVTSAMFVF